MFSSIGDALLNHDYFPHGMAAFAIAQLFYISAFGFEPLIPLIGIVLYAGAIASMDLVVYFLPMKAEFRNVYDFCVLPLAAVYILHTKLDLMLLMGLPIYTTLLVTMCWRAIARMCTKVRAAEPQPNYIAQWSFARLFHCFSERCETLASDMRHCQSSICHIGCDDCHQ